MNAHASVDISFYKHKQKQKTLTINIDPLKVFWRKLDNITVLLLWLLLEDIRTF